MGLPQCIGCGCHLVRPAIESGVPVAIGIREIWAVLSLLAGGLLMLGGFMGLARRNIRAIAVAHGLAAVGGLGGPALMAVGWIAWRGGAGAEWLAIGVAPLLPGLVLGIANALVVLRPPLSRNPDAPLA